MGFTAIVGSNGSGKSNILDAFLFVFGINSLKALRASRMTDLVNNQAKDDYAKVEIDLEDLEKEKKITISRTIDTGGKSVLRLNDRRVTLNEVSSMLEEMGIKPYGHNIVVQGDVTRIIEMNAIQRREMIDEVAGIREFDEKKKEAEKELGNVETRIKEVRIVLSERQSQLEQLSQDRQAAIHHNELQEELKKTKATLFKAEILRLSDELQKNQEKTLRLTEEKQKREERLTQTRIELTELEAEIEEANKVLLAASQKTFSEIGILIEEKKSEKRVREERFSARQTATEKILIRKEQLEKRLVEIESDLREKGKQFEEKNIQAQEIEKRIAEKQSELGEIKEGLLVKNKELKELETELAGFEEEEENQTKAFFEKQSTVSANQKAMDFRRQQANELQAELNQVNQRISGMQQKQGSLSELLSKYPKPLSQQQDILHNIELAVQQISYSESSLDSVKKSILALEKTKAACPTCDSKLSEKQKNDVLESKRSEEKRLLIRIKEAHEKRGQLLDEKKSMETVIEKVNELERFVAPLKELLPKKNQLEEKLSGIKASLDERKILELENELKAFREKMEDAQDKTEQQKSKVNEFKAKSNFDALNRLSEEINSLTRQLNGVLGIRKELELQTKMVLLEEKESDSKELERLSSEKKDLSALLEKERVESKAIEVELEKLNREMVKAEEQNRDLVEKKERLTKKQLDHRERIEKDNVAIRDFERKMTELEVEKGKFEVRKTDVSEEAQNFVEFPTFETFDVKQLRERLPQIEREISKMGAINQKALENFGEYEQEMLEIKKKADRLEEERLAVMDMMQKIEDRRTEVFMNCFEQINSNFREMQFLLGEGTGQLALESPERPLESGLLIEANVRGKQNQNIDSMSGGEKTLTALSFLFAIQLYDNAPFYIFDEADAALDKENSAKLARIIAKISQKNQFIGITHNDTVVKQANQIIGVALNEQRSSVVGLRLKEAGEGAAA